MQATISLEKRNPKAAQSNFYLLARRAKEKENTRNPAHQPQIKLTKGRRKSEWSTTIVSNVAAWPANDIIKHNEEQQQRKRTPQLPPKPHKKAKSILHKRKT
jgi:hypothetical protein